MQPSLRTHLSSNDIDIDLRRILDFIAQSCIYISLEIKKLMRGKAGTINVYNEEQCALDVWADKLLLDRLSKEKSFGILDFVSEEADKICTINTKGGRYSVSVDPLDGSSLVDVNLAIGTIISVHDGPIMSHRCGRDTLVAAMYVLYGPLTSLVYCAGHGSHEFILDGAGNFILSNENIKMKEKGNIYSAGGIRSDWDDSHRNYIEKLEEYRYKLRYTGAFVGDINQLLLKGGGVYSYSSTKDDPNGKLRLHFELQPMAYIIEHAGGAATDGNKNILDIIPNSLEQRCPIYIGSKYEVGLKMDCK
jgi:fructose-1,6-bisphosphatase I